MHNLRLIVPHYYRIVECREGRWFFKKTTRFYNLLPIAVDFQDLELLYGISKQQIVNEMFRMKEGQTGFYLANLRHKRYYYCGIDVADIKAMLRSLGIGRDDPIDD